MRDDCAAGTEITEVPYAMSDFAGGLYEFEFSNTEETAVSSGLEEFFEDLNVYPAAKWSNYCANSIISCGIENLVSGPIVTSNVRVGDRSEGFIIYAKTNNFAGYTTEEFVLSCTNGIQTILGTTVI